MLNRNIEEVDSMKETILLNLFGRQIILNSYSLFMNIAVIALIIISVYSIKRAGLSIKSSLICFLVMIPAMLVGARALNVLINWGYYTENTWRIFALNTSGFSLMGGLLLSAILGSITARTLGISPWELGDAIVPALGVGLVIMRIGCFLNGCCYGLPTKLPWAVKFPYNSFAHRHYLDVLSSTKSITIFNLIASPGVHPTQIYEIIGTLIATIFAIVIFRRKNPKGVAILSFAIIFTITRLINHFFRVHPSTNQVSLWFYPTIYIGIIIFLSILLYRRNKSLS